MLPGAFWLELRYAARTLRHSSAFTLTTALVLATGIAAVATTWNVFATVVLDAVPGPYGSRIVNVSFASPAVPSLHSGLTVSSVEELRAHTAVFEEVAAYQRTASVSIHARGAEATVTPLLVSTRFFQVFGVAPLAGRWFADDEVVAGHDRVVVLSEGLWRDAFGADPNIVGKPIDVDGQPYTAVGVMPRSFAVPQPAISLWMPETVGAPQLRSPKARNENTVARLRGSISVEDATRYAAVLVPAVDRDTREDLRFEVVPLRDGLIGPNVGRVLRLFLAAVTLVLLIACANASILLLIRGTARARENAIRLALGASTRRVALLAGVEVCLLGAMGALAGIGLTAVATSVVRAWGPVDVRRLTELRFDGRTVLAVIGAASGAALACGLVPVWRTTRAIIDERMKPQATSVRVHAAFVLVQGALVVVLAVGAGLLLRSTWKLLTIDLGFDTRNVAAIQFKGVAGRPGSGAADALLTEARDAVRLLPGVETVSSTMLAPGEPGGIFTYLAAERRSGVWQIEAQRVFYQTADEEYFRAMGIPIVRGRGFQVSDIHGAPCVAVINEALAKDAWRGDDPLGQRVDLNVDDGTRLDPPQLCTVVGIAKNTRFHLEANPEPFIYFSTHQKGPAMRALVVRGGRSGPVPLQAVLDRLHALDPRLDVDWSGTLNNMLDFQIAQPRFYAFLFTSFAAAGLLLAGIGVYGAAAYAVARRRREIGIRIALGAGGGHIVRTSVGTLALAALAGIAVGAIASVFASTALQSLLFEVRAHDATAFIAAPTTIALAVLAATLPAARRAVRVSPADLLRDE